MKTMFKISFFILLLSVAVNAQWLQQNSGTALDLRSVKAVSNSVIWVAGDNGVVLNSTDGGATWNVKTSTQGGYYNFGIASFDSDTALVIGSTYPGGSDPYQAKIWKTTDSGNSWSEKHYSASNVCGSIHFFDLNNGLYLGDPNPLNSSQWNILTTTDGGNNWNRVLPNNYPPSDSVCGEFGIVRNYGVYENTIWFSTYYESCPTVNNRIYRSTDKGYTWTSFDMPFKGDMAAWISFNSSTYGLAISILPGIVARTTDGGATWAILDTIGIFPQAIRNVPGYSNFFLTVGQDGSANGSSFYSNSSGNSWNPLSMPTQSGLQDVSLTQNDAWAVGINGTILTLDITSIIPVELTSFTASALGNEVALSWSTATELNNRGFEIQRKAFGSEFATVAFMKGQGTTTQQNQYSFVDKNLDEGKYFYRLKQIDFGGKYEYSQAVEVDVRTLDNYTLEQNYPNPFNPTTTIGYVLQEKGNARLTMLNSLGEEIAVLINEEQDKGYHKVELEATKLSSGVYFYQLKAGEFIQTRKMILMK